MAFKLGMKVGLTKVMNGIYTHGRFDNLDLNLMQGHNGLAEGKLQFELSN